MYVRFPLGVREATPQARSCPHDVIMHGTPAMIDSSNVCPRGVELQVLSRRYLKVS